jgi:GNAT superfamily N-acetyltransferase
VAEAGIVVRRARPDEREAVVALAAEALGWRAGEPNAELFAWKHDHNVFGPSPQWVAEVDGRLAGFRTFLRWRFRAPSGELLTAVRAVDTATHPDFQGRGVFRALTVHAVEELREEGVGFVFNTPNDKSRPGYLKMGWREVGAVPVAVRPAGPAALARMARARVPAAKWSLPCRVGEPAEAVFAGGDRDGLEELLGEQPPVGGLTTDRSPAYYAWRYRLEPLAYRVVLAGASLREGFAVFRLRARGEAVECALCEVVVPGGDRRAADRLAATVARRTRADYAIRVDRATVSRAAFVRLPGQGPVLTWRALQCRRMPRKHEWCLTLGDVELF